MRWTPWIQTPVTPFHALQELEQVSIIPYKTGVVSIGIIIFEVICNHDIVFCLYLSISNRFQNSVSKFYHQHFIPNWEIWVMAPVYHEIPELYQLALTFSTSVAYA